METCFFASPPFSGARSVIHQLAPYCQHIVRVCWLFFNFTVSFDFGCCSLAQEMSLWTSTCSISGRGNYYWTAVSPSAFPASVYWSFTWRLAPCPSPILLFAWCSAPHPLSCVLVFSSLFIVQFFCCFVFNGWGWSVCLGGYMVYPRGGWGNTTW
jgi:hypothetical protein